MSKIIVDQIEPNNGSSLNFKGDVTITGKLKVDPVFQPNLVITHGANPPNGVSAPGFGTLKNRGANTYEFGMNFGNTGKNPPTDWSSLTGWLFDPYSMSQGGDPGINTQFRDAMAIFKPDFVVYPKGAMSLYWDWVNNDFVSKTEFTIDNLPYQEPYNNLPNNSLLPYEYDKTHPDYKEVRPAAHIDNFAAWFSDLQSIRGVGDKMYIFGNLYLETGVNTTNPNLTDYSLRDQAISYKERQRDPINVAYIELGHEYHLQGSSEPDVSPDGGYAKRFENGGEYAQACIRYLQQIRGDVRLNDVYCAANLCTPAIGNSTYQAQRRNLWNTKFIEEYFTNQTYLSDTDLYKLDAISIHNFFTILSTSNAYDNFETWVLDAADQHYINLRNVINNCKTAIQTSTPQLPQTPDPKYWAIGYNLDDRQFTSNISNAISGCWGHGLFNLHYQFRLMADFDISVTAIHSSHGGRQYGMFYSVVNGFGNNTTQMYDLTATGYVFEILRDAEKNTSSMQPLMVAGANAQTTVSNGVYGMIFYADLTNTVFGPSTKSASLLFINLSSEPRTLDLSGIISPEDVILKRRSVWADNLRLRVNGTFNGVKEVPEDDTEYLPANSDVILSTIKKHGVLQIDIGVSFTHSQYKDLSDDLSVQ